MGPGAKGTGQPPARELGVLNSRGGSSAALSVDQANTELRALQFKAVTNYNRLRDGVARLGTSMDTVKFRQQLSGYSRALKDLGAEFRQKVGQHPDRDAGSTQKLLRDFQTLLEGAEKLMAVAREKESAKLPLAEAAPLTAAPRGAPEALESEAAAQQRQQLVEREAQIRFNDVLIEERDRAVQTINSQIGEVHQIFQDLAVLVSDQGAQLDDIEANIGRAADHTAQANTQLVGAQRAQRRSQKCWCTLLVALAISVFVLILIIIS